MWRKEDIVKMVEKDKGNSSLRAYASASNCSHTHIADVLNNRCEPSQELLDHLGIEKEVVKTVTYKPKKKWRKE